MAVNLQKLPGRPAELGMYRLTGDLEDLDGPGRRTIRELEVTKVRGETDALRTLRTLPDLERLTISSVDGVALEPLTGIDLSYLAIGDGRHLDLAPLARLERLQTLMLSGLEDCRVPDELKLPATLETLVLLNDAPGGTPQVVEALVKAITWDALPRLRSLDIRCGGLRDVPPARVDLGFLHDLPNLERLEMSAGVIHDGPGPSPLEPPFDGLPRGLTWLRIEANDAELLAEQLQAVLPSAYPVVYPRPDDDDDDGEAVGDWAIIEPDPDDPDSVWQTYGSLADTFGDTDFELEHDAYTAARARLREADRERADRIEFDQEAAGTGLRAPTRDDLAWALGALGLA